MKTKGSKTLKAKRSEIGIKNTRAKLLQYKAKKKVIKKKQGSFLKCLKMKSPKHKNEVTLYTRSSPLKRQNESKKGNLECKGLDTENSPGMSSPSILKLKGNQKVQSPFTPKGKKKSLKLQHDTEEETDVIIKYSTGMPLNSNAESMEVQSYCKYESNSEQRNLGTPVVVEALSTSLTSLSIPESLQDQPHLISKKKVDDIVPYVYEEVSQDESTCILVAKASPYVPQKDKRRNSNVALPKKPHAKRQSTPRESTANRQCTIREVEDNTNNNTLSDLNESTNNNCENANESILDKGDEYPIQHRKNPSELIRDENAPQFYCIRNKVIVIMKENCRFCFTGKLTLKVIHGSVQVYGCIITRKSGAKEIYSPRGYSSVAIQTYPQSPDQNNVNISSSLLAEGIQNDVKNRLVDDITRSEPGVAVILLSNLENKLTKFLKLFYPFRLFSKIKNMQYSSWTDPRRTEAILQSNLYFGDFSCKDLIFDSSLVEEVSQNILNRWRANEWSCAVIAGGKGVGKSTTTRYLINTVLRTSGKVILLDLDPGQAECTPPACISYSVIEEPLLGPNFTHLKTPVFQLYLGDVNVSRCLSRYIEGMKMLVDKLTSCPVLSRLPIVVNTMGFSQGLGWNIIIFTLKLIRPSLVVQIMSERSKNNYPDFLSSKVANEQEFQWATWCSNVVDWKQPCIHELHVIYSQAERKNVPGTESWNMEPYQQRELAMVSYLSQILDFVDEPMSSYSQSSTCINQVVPYATPLSALSISIPDACVPPSHALTVVNGNIVALCGIDIQTDDTDIHTKESESTTSSPRLLTRSPLCACYGFGIVRGVDMESREVFINTPLHKSIMQHVNCLVGCIPVPVTLLQLNCSKNIPYTGGNDVLPTSREPRRGYFRMRYQNTQNTS